MSQFVILFTVILLFVFNRFSIANSQDNSSSNFIKDYSITAVINNNIGPLKVDDLTTDSIGNILRMDSNYYAPAYEAYLFWDTMDVHPYKADFTKKTDTTMIIMQDSVSHYVHPILRKINSNFGYRRYRFHYGVDIDLDYRDSVLNAFDGMVRIIRKSTSYGNVVVVRHYNGLETLYAHLTKAKVKINQEVKAGDLIGLGGSTGRSTGPHLHFEVRFVGEPINPNDIIDFKTGKLKCDTLQLNKSHFAYLVDLRKMKYHTIRNGDTLSRISRKYGVSVNKLCALNNMKTTSILRIGRKLRYN